MEMIFKYIERFENLRKVQKDCQIEEITARFTERELVELCLMLNTLKDLLNITAVIPD